VFIEIVLNIYLIFFSNVERTNESALEQLRNRAMETNTSFSKTLSLFESKNKEYLDTQNKLNGSFYIYIYIYFYYYKIGWIIF